MVHFRFDRVHCWIHVNQPLSGDPAHQHQYITVGVNTPSSTR